MLNKILVIPDVHIWDEYRVGFKRKGISSRLNDFIIAAKQINAIIKNKKVRFVIFVGDLFHKRRHDALTTKYVSKFIRIIKAGNAKVDFIFNVGNHDQTDAEGKNDYLKPLVEGMKGHINCPDYNGESYMVDDTVFFVMPYTKKPEDFIRKIKMLLSLNKHPMKFKLKILITHQDIKGMVWDGGRPADKGLEESDVSYLRKNFDLIINGHHHESNCESRVPVGKILNVGVTIPIDFKTVNDMSHVVLLKFENKKYSLNYIYLENLPMFVEENVTDPDHHKLEKKEYKHFLKIKIKGTKLQIERFFYKHKSFLKINENYLQSYHIEPTYVLDKMEYTATKDFSMEELIENYLFESGRNTEEKEYALEKLELT